MGTKKERIYGKGAPQAFGEGQLPQTAPRPSGSATATRTPSPTTKAIRLT